jgi:hypothetical protein
MDQQTKCEAVASSELFAVSGGIWDYSNRMGYLGAILEARQDRPYGNVFGPKTIDEAADQMNHGWVTVK